MKKVLIETMSDWNDCEQCGGGSEYGGRVTIDDKVIFEHIPIGSCYDNKDTSLEQLLIKAIEAMGGEVQIEYDVDTGWDDYEYHDDAYL